MTHGSQSDSDRQHERTRRYNYYLLTAIYSGYSKVPILFKIFINNFSRCVSQTCGNQQLRTTYPQGIEILLWMTTTVCYYRNNVPLTTIRYTIIIYYS